MYTCPNCGKKFKAEEIESLRCTYCGSKILFKETPPVARKVSTD
ncbi:DNA-directed RNA polymerase subunit P [Candidatus Micrarchaeota archaeon CG08_land_8_20_14_0_20_59_11]|nr:MAG: DNA-directed RNA polymerase subunit P [Candidatus Micrarchaeota archaeon CG08_land_8_20_14_0_20_59_11]PIT86011.1 MAG: DNA-directed RNA polymerase subunit P [Candidatus Micrarchaeota archaeon CG10_big_fil_rev_8_21_14_0_10_59_7]